MNLNICQIQIETHKFYDKINLNIEINTVRQGNEAGFMSVQDNDARA